MLAHSKTESATPGFAAPRSDKSKPKLASSATDSSKPKQALPRSKGGRSIWTGSQAGGTGSSQEAPCNDNDGSGVVTPTAGRS